MPDVGLAAKLKAFGSAARKEGCSFYPQPCRPTEIVSWPTSSAKRDDMTSTAYTTGCGSTARVGIPYISRKMPTRRAGEVGECIVCAIDDRAYDFPRFSQ